MAESLEAAEPAIEGQQENQPSQVQEEVAQPVEPSRGDIPTDLVQFFKDTLSDNEATFVVFFRGLWWPYCKVTWLLSGMLTIWKGMTAKVDLILLVRYNSPHALCDTPSWSKKK